MRWRRLRRLGPWWIAFGLAVAGVAITPFGQARLGGYLLGTALLASAVARALLPPEGAGGLRVRRTWIDIATLVGLAAVVFLAYTLVRVAPAP
ncbi:MAG: DUF3017 domain-containing protein [Dermatophilaceae bacterium]